MALELGSILEGTVTGITNFGAFVRLPDGNTGLVHISEVADEYVTDVHHYVQEHQTIQVKVLACNEQGKYDLSIKQVGGAPDRPQQNFADETQPSPPLPPRGRSQHRRGPGESGGKFEDMLGKWKKESEERLLDVKRSRESKRGGGRGGRSK